MLRIIFKFQFLKGTIKRAAIEAIAGIISGFNSSKVRLKDYEKIQITNNILCFNSSKVRLKEEKRSSVYEKYKFQFLKGTIKRVGVGNNPYPVPSFNSSKVRLKG